MSKRIWGLDGLRATAFLAVLGYHYLPGLLPGGFLGVNVFFVLSGYLMALTSLRDFERDAFHPGRFYLRRARRIYPTLIFTLGGWICLTRLIEPSLLGLKQGEVFSILLGYDNLWQLGENVSYFDRAGGPSPFTHTWSLAIEMQFYLVWPLLFALYVRARGKGRSGLLLPGALALASLIVMELGYVPESDPSSIYYGSHTRVWALLLGAMLGLAQGGQRQRFSGGGLPGLLLILGFGALFFTVSGTEELTYRLYLPLSALLTLGLLWLLGCCPILGMALDYGPLGWLGKRSYELYLCHYPAYYLVSRLTPGRMGGAQLALALGLSLLWAAWLYRASQALTALERRESYEKRPVPPGGHHQPDPRYTYRGRRRSCPAHLAGNRPGSGRASSAGVGGQRRCP